MSKLFYFLLVFGITSCKTNPMVNKSIDTVCQIDFQDFFDNDTVSLKINHCLIFKDTILISKKSIGITDVSVKVSAVYKGKRKVSFMNKAVVCDDKTAEITLFILLNGHENVYNIDLSKGKYIGLSKKNMNELSFSQSALPFVYD